MTRLNASDAWEEWVRTAKKHTGFGNDILYVDRRLFCLGGNIATGGDNNERVGLAVGILYVKAAEENGCRRNDALSQLEFLAELGDD